MNPRTDPPNRNGATFRNGVTLNIESCSPISRMMKRAVIGVPS